MRFLHPVPAELHVWCIAPWPNPGAHMKIFSPHSSRGPRALQFLHLLRPLESSICILSQICIDYNLAGVPSQWLVTVLFRKLTRKWGLCKGILELISIPLKKWLKHTAMEMDYILKTLICLRKTKNRYIHGNSVWIIGHLNNTKHDSFLLNLYIMSEDWDLNQ